MDILLVLIVALAGIGLAAPLGRGRRDAGPTLAVALACVAMLAAPILCGGLSCARAEEGQTPAWETETVHAIVSNAQTQPLEDSRRRIRLGDEVEVSISCMNSAGERVNISATGDEYNPESARIRIGRGDLLGDMDLMLIGRETGDFVSFILTWQKALDDGTEATESLHVTIGIIAIHEEIPAIDDALILSAAAYEAEGADAAEGADCFTVCYHMKDGKSASDEVTQVAYGEKTPTLTVEELGFFTPGWRFLGWKVYRSDTGCWLAVDRNGNGKWVDAEPEARRCHLLGNGEVVSTEAYPGAELHLYAQWEETNAFKVYYHSADNAAASDYVTEVIYGKRTKLFSYERLGFANRGKRFAGWRVYRSDMRGWAILNQNGERSWEETVPEGGNYYLYQDEQVLRKAAPAGAEVHLYAQWDDESAYTVYYHRTDYDDAGPIVSKVDYGTKTATLSYEANGFAITGKKFAGWKAYRPDTENWCVEGADGSIAWEKNVAVGQRYHLFPNEAAVDAIVPAGSSVHFYGQWVDTDEFTVCYHRQYGEDASRRITCRYGDVVAVQGAAEAGYRSGNLCFEGWRLYRGDLQSWSIIDENGEPAWAETLPEGGEYRLYSGGDVVEESFEAGSSVHFYGQWSDAYTIYYHLTDYVEPAEATTHGRYRERTRTEPFDRLGFAITGKRFAGWKLYSTDLQSWRVLDGEGQPTWSKVTQDVSQYCIYPNGAVLDEAPTIGSALHLYAQWVDTDRFVVYYHCTDTADACEQTTEVVYGEGAKTLTVKALGFTNGKKAFLGWKAYRTDNQKWLVVDAFGNKEWADTAGVGQTYQLLKNGRLLRSFADPGAEVHLYAQWGDAP